MYVIERFFNRYQISALDGTALMGSIDVFRGLLEHGVDVNDQDQYGGTSLHRAVSHGREDRITELLDLLLYAGAYTASPTTDEGSMRLHLATERLDSGDATALLLGCGAKMNAWNKKGYTPFHCVAMSGNLASTRAFLAVGADLTCRAYHEFKETPLDTAPRLGRVEIVREFVRHGVCLNALDYDSGCIALHHAMFSEEADVAEILVQAGASITAKIFSTYTPLHFAVERLYPAIIHVLLRNGAHVRGLQGDEDNRRRQTLLHMAVRWGSVEVVNVLLRLGVDESELNSNGKTASQIIGNNAIRTYLSDPTRSRQAVANLHSQVNLPVNARRMRELLASAPADWTWRRRGILLLSLAHKRAVRKRTERVARTAKGKEALAEGSGDVSDDRGDNLGVLTTAVAAGRRKGETSPTKIGITRARFRFDPGGGRGSGGGGSNDSSGDDFTGVVEKGFLRTLVRFL